MSVLSSPILHLIREANVGHDVLFKLMGKFGDHVELKAHKLILASYSTVLKAQFYGAQAEQNKMAEQQNRGPSEMRLVEIVEVKDFSAEAFVILIKLLYGQVEALRECNSYDILFQVHGLADKYLMIYEVMKNINKRIKKLTVSMETLFDGLETASHYKNLEGYKEISESLSMKCVATVRAEFKDDVKEIFRFLYSHNEEKTDLVHILMGLLSQDDPVKCTRCTNSPGQCKHSKQLGKATPTPAPSKPSAGKAFKFREEDLQLPAFFNFNAGAVQPTSSQIFHFSA